MSFLFKIKDTVYKWIGIILILFGVLMVAVSVEHLFIPEDRAIAINILGFCTPVVLVPGILFIYFGLMAERERRGYEKLAAYLKAYRRIKILALAKKLNISEYEAERRILKCVRLKFMTGHIDRATDEFFNPFGMEGKVMISCPHCAAPVEQLVLDGETAKCPYCDSVIQAKK